MNPDFNKRNMSFDIKNRLYICGKNFINKFFKLCIIIICNITR